MTLTQLTYLVAVAETGSFLKAASRCFVTQPTLSMQVKKLERQLGETLLDRTRQPVVPTQLGRRVIEQARVVVREHSRISDIVSQSRGVVAGEYRLGVIPTVASSLLPLILGPFTKAYPEVVLSVEELTTKNLIQALLEDRLDGGLAATPLREEKLEETPLYYEDFMVFSQDKRLLSRKTISPGVLEDLDVLLMNEGHCFRDQAIEICSTGHGTRLRYESGSFKTLIKLVEVGQGSTLLPQLVALGLPRRQSKYLRPFASPIPRREVSLVTHRRLAKQAIHDSLTEVIRQELPDEVDRRRGRKGRVLDPV